MSIKKVTLVETILSERTVAIKSPLGKKEKMPKFSSYQDGLHRTLQLHCPKDRCLANLRSSIKLKEKRKKRETHPVQNNLSRAALQVTG